ncbi:MAG: hypothetical protein JXA71_14265, partial [Chitinispirillaceae bacterium]|nr:hypothetical protein [Chitinispirillaceae bacterium]
FSLHQNPYREPLVVIPPAVQISPGQKNSIDSLAVRLDSLTVIFLRFQASGRAPSSVKKKWLTLVREAETLQKTIHANEKLLFLLGELYRIGIFFGVPDAAQSAEFYLSQCIGLPGTDYRPFMLLAWLYLRRGCQSSEKTRYLLQVVDRRLGDAYSPYLHLLWGHYYYYCRSDPEKAFGYFISYLAFDPDDNAARRTYREIKRQLGAKNRS